MWLFWALGSSGVDEPEWSETPFRHLLFSGFRKFLYIIRYNNISWRPQNPIPFQNMLGVATPSPNSPILTTMIEWQRRLRLLWCTAWCSYTVTDTQVL